MQAPLNNRNNMHTEENTLTKTPLVISIIIIFLRKRSAVEAITAHATFDIISVVLGFIIYYGK